MFVWMSYPNQMYWVYGLHNRHYVAASWVHRMTITYHELHGGGGGGDYDRIIKSF